jgi:hypothetical protein
MQTDSHNTQSVYSTELSAEPNWQYTWTKLTVQLTVRFKAGDVINDVMWGSMYTAGD